MHGCSAYSGEYASILHDFRVTAEHVRAHPTFLAGAAGEVLGFYSLITDPAELDMLFVADRAQGAGLGARLVGHLLEQARARGLTTVKVVSHPPAEGFYRRMGARRVGVVPARPPKVTWERPELAFDVGPR
nr:GNAT family N-acetyltransferase [Saccharothrix espanaensis]